MEEVLVRAELVTLPDAPAPNAVTIAIPRRDVETALAHEDGPMDLVLDFAPAADAQPAEQRKIAISWERDQLEHLLQTADGDVIKVVFDGDGLARLVDPDFELHGLREGLAILAVAAVGAAAAAGVAAGAPIDEGASGGPTAAGYATIEQARGPVPDSAGVIEAVRSAAANTGAAGAGIEATRSAEPLVAADSGTMGAGIEAVRSADAAAPGAGAAGAGIEAVRSSDPLVASDSGSMAAGIEAVRSADAAPLTGSTLSDEGISISMPSPELVGLAGGMTLLLLGAAFVSRGRRPGQPA